MKIKLTSSVVLFATYLILIFSGLSYFNETQEINNNFSLSLESALSYILPIPFRSNTLPVAYQKRNGWLLRTEFSKSRRFMSESSNYYAGMDLYQIIGAKKTDDQDAINSSYRKQILLWNPNRLNDDKKKEGEERLIEINRAYSILSDPDSRKRYDLYGEENAKPSAQYEDDTKDSEIPGFGGFEGLEGTGLFQDFSSIFDQLFGGSISDRKNRNTNRPIAGEDIEVETTIPFMTAIFGGQESVKVKRLEECGTCNGFGSKSGSKLKKCATCGGQGLVNNVQRTSFGIISSTQTCPKCDGNGEMIEDSCNTCKGKGVIPEFKEVIIKIPAGVEDETSLRVRGSGHSGRRGGPKGDLFVRVKIKKDPKFRRDGADIHTVEEISYIDAILGTTIQADTIDGKQDVKVAAGTQPEQKIRLRGKGVPKLGSDARGDAFITVKVKIPTSTSSRERELLDQLSDISDKKWKSFL